MSASETRLDRRAVPRPAAALAAGTSLAGPAIWQHQTLKHGDTFAVFDRSGNFGASSGGPDGLFHLDTRFLSRLELLVFDVAPLLLGAKIRDDNAVLTVDLTNPDVMYDGTITLPRDTLHVERTIFLWRGACHQRIAIHNYGDRPVNVPVSLFFDSDFADVFEVRGAHRKRRGTIRRSVAGACDVLLEYDGLDGGHTSFWIQRLIGSLPIAPTIKFSFRRDAALPALSERAASPATAKRQSGSARGCAARGAISGR